MFAFLPVKRVLVHITQRVETLTADRVADRDRVGRDLGANLERKQPESIPTLKQVLPAGRRRSLGAQRVPPRTDDALVMHEAVGEVRCGPIRQIPRGIEEAGREGAAGRLRTRLHEDRHPARIRNDHLEFVDIARKVDALNKLLTARTQLSNLLTFMDGKNKAEDLIGKLLQNPELLKSLAAAPKPAEPAAS